MPAQGPWSTVAKQKEGFSGSSQTLAQIWPLQGTSVFATQQGVICLLVTPFFSGDTPLFVLQPLQQLAAPPALGQANQSILRPWCRVQG